MLIRLLFTAPKAHTGCLEERSNNIGRRRSMCSPGNEATTTTSVNGLFPEAGSLMSGKLAMAYSITNAARHDLCRSSNKFLRAALFQHRSLPSNSAHDGIC